MRTRRQKHRLALMAAGIGLAGLAASMASAQGNSYTLEWHSMDGGGGVSGPNFGYSVSGSVGQAEAGPPLTSVFGHSVQSGFWAVPLLTGTPTATATATATATPTPTATVAGPPGGEFRLYLPAISNSQP